MQVWIEGLVCDSCTRCICLQCRAEFFNESADRQGELQQRKDSPELGHLAVRLNNVRVQPRFIIHRGIKKRGKQLHRKPDIDVTAFEKIVRRPVVGMQNPRALKITEFVTIADQSESK